MRRNLRAFHAMRHILFALVGVVPLAGCRIVSIDSVPPPPVPTVDVIGLQQQPTQVAVPAEGLTLLRALLQANGTPDVVDPLVKLRRQIDGGVTNYYLPLELVENDLAGEIQLSPGDIVSVVSAGVTNLHQKGTATKEFQVAGLSSVELSRTEREQIASSSNIANVVKASESRQLLPEDTNVVLLHRTSGYVAAG